MRYIKKFDEVFAEAAVASVILYGIFRKIKNVIDKKSKRKDHLAVFDVLNSIKDGKINNEDYTISDNGNSYYIRLLECKMMLNKAGKYLSIGTFGEKLQLTDEEYSEIVSKVKELI